MISAAGPQASSRREVPEELLLRSGRGEVLAVRVYRRDRREAPAEREHRSSRLRGREEVLRTGLRQPPCSRVYRAEAEEARSRVWGAAATQG